MLVNIVLDIPKGDTQVVLNVSQGKFKFLARSKLKWKSKKNVEIFIVERVDFILHLLPIPYRVKTCLMFYHAKTSLQGKFRTISLAANFADFPISPILRLII